MAVGGNLAKVPLLQPGALGFKFWPYFDSYFLHLDVHLLAEVTVPADVLIATLTTSSGQLFATYAVRNASKRKDPS
jgi:hypothetical protein